MARQRMIKPEFFSSESIAECSFAARLCFIGLWTCADDKGHLKFAPKGLRKDIFGLDDVSFDDFIGYLIELEDTRCIRFYAVGESVYIDIPNFLVYQKICNPSKTANPTPDQGKRVSLREGYMRAIGGLYEDSHRTSPKELIKEVINEEGAAGSSADALPAPFQGTEDWKNDYLERFGGGSDD